MIRLFILNHNIRRNPPPQESLFFFVCVPFWETDEMQVVRPVGGQTKKNSLRVAAAIASAVGLVALSVRIV